MSYIGSNKITGIYYNNNKIVKAYYNNGIVFSSGNSYSIYRYTASYNNRTIYPIAVYNNKSLVSTIYGWNGSWNLTSGMDIIRQQNFFNLSWELEGSSGSIFTSIQAHYRGSIEFTASNPTLLASGNSIKEVKYIYVRGSIEMPATGGAWYQGNLPNETVDYTFYLRKINDSTIDSKCYEINNGEMVESSEYSCEPSTYTDGSMKSIKINFLSRYQSATIIFSENDYLSAFNF